MRVAIEIEDSIIQKIKKITAETGDHEAIKVALDRFIREYETVKVENSLADEQTSDLPDEYWDELFSEPMLPAGTLNRIIREEREDRF